MLIKKITILLLAIQLPAMLVAQAETELDVWEPIQFLVGKWEGKGDGKSGISTVWKEWHFVLNRNFLHMRTKAIFDPQEKNPRGEIHEDQGYFSYDKARQKIVFRQFHVEGFVIQYVLESISDEGKSLTFVSEKIENGPAGLQAKIVYKIMDANTVEERFELAFPGREFDCYMTNIIKRKN